MSIRPTHRSTARTVQVPSGQRSDEIAEFAVDGVPSTSSTTPTGQSLDTRQPAAIYNAKGQVPTDLLYLSAQGGLDALPVAPLGVTPNRLALFWQAGRRGKPGINADILATSEATRMITDPEFEILGTNGVSALCTHNAEGGLLLTTAGADGDQMILVPHLDANQSPWTTNTWGTDKEVGWECLIATQADIDDTIIWAGLKLTNTSVTATDDDQVFFRYEDDVNSGKFQAVASIGGTDVETDTGVTVAASTSYRLSIVIGADRVARFYINHVLVYTSEALTDATDMIPYIGVEVDGSAVARAIGVYSQFISRTVG